MGLGRAWAGPGEHLGRAWAGPGPGLGRAWAGLGPGEVQSSYALSIVVVDVESHAHKRRQLSKAHMGA